MTINKCLLVCQRALHLSSQRYTSYLFNVDDNQRRKTTTTTHSFNSQMPSAADYLNSLGWTIDQNALHLPKPR